ncbi:MATE family efflux transporter [Candidatus Woesearchaeota archaeon]|jgi:putative MATE family efflux protein|nr:MATE family efflux transporter [Candidatus Woesearchaeota archaeon]
MTNNYDLTKGSISKLIKQIALPASIGFFFNTMYNVVDTFYAGLISTEALSALSITFPIFFIIIALGAGMGTGTTALIANALGANQNKKAKLYSIQAISLGIFIGIMASILGILFSPFLFGILGATGSYLELALSYINIIFLSGVFFILTFILNGILNAHGDTKSFRNYLIIGFFLNLILNPLFMFGWGIIKPFGIKGIAIATLIIELIGTIYMLYRVYNLVFKELKIKPNLFPNLNCYYKLIKQGLPASLNMMTVALGIFIITYYISQFSNEAVAAYGIAIRIEQIVLLPTIGLNFATLALVGQNNGAKKFNRVKKSIFLVLKYGLIIMTIGTILLILFSENLLSIFTNDETVIRIGVEYLKFAAFLTWAYALLHSCVSALQGLKKPMFALWLGIYRQIVGPLLLFPFLAITLSLGLYGIWWGIFIITWSGAIFTYIYLISYLKRISIK